MTAPGYPPDADARLLRALRELSASGKAMEAGDLVKLVAQRTCELLHGDAVALYLWDEAAEQLVPAYTDDPRAPPDDPPLRSGEGAAGQALLSRQVVIVRDYPGREFATPLALQQHLLAAEAVPLLVADRAIGALVVRFYTPHTVTLEDERILELLAAHVAPALEAARLYATSNLERQHERVLREITQALASDLDERRVLDLAVEYGAGLLDAPYARVWVVEPDGLRCAAAKGFVQPDTFQRRLALDSSSGIAAQQQVVSLPDAPNDPHWYFNREFGARTGLGAYLGAGLWRAGLSLGVLEVMRHTGRHFSHVEQQLLVSLANAVAVAVSNARTHSAAEQLAREAQQRAAEVAASESLLRSVYEAIGSGVLVFDDHGMVVNANAAAAEILARSVGSMRGMTVADFHASRTTVLEDGSSMPLEAHPVLVALRTRCAVRKMIYRIGRPDGEYRWLEVDAVPLPANEGGALQVVTSFVDISDRKHSEQALHERDVILDAVASAAERLLGAADWERGIDPVLHDLGTAAGVSRVYIGPGHAEVMAQRHEWVADSVPPRTVADDRPLLQALGLPRWEALLREGSIIQGPQHSFPAEESAALSRQGVCSIVVVPIFAGQAWWGFIGFDDCRSEREWPAGVVEVLRTAAGTLGAAIERRRADIERMQLVREQSARAEAEAGQRRMAFLAEASHVLVSSLDYETTLQTLAHLAVPTLADYCALDIVEGDGYLRRVGEAGIGRGGPVLEPWRIPDPPHPIARVLATGAPETFPRLTRDLELPQVDLSLFSSALLVPLLTRTGPAGVITCLGARDRPAFDSRDLNLIQDLARRCAIAMDNARLYREARDAISIRDEFLSVAAHELKTPLTSLRGYAQLLGREFERSETPDPERTRRASMTIQLQADKLARLVGQLLDISRLESGRLAIERRPTDLSQLVREVVESAGTQTRRHTIVADLPDELPMLLDPLRIEQVVTNLVDNAIKYSPDGGQIDVSITVDDTPDGVRLAVRDRGVGVPLEHRAHIFDRFYQAHAGGALTSTAGMGLGLYISRQIVELHGGTIEAEFPSDRGTRVAVTLPRM